MNDNDIWECITKFYEEEFWEPLSRLENTVEHLTNKVSILWKAFELLEQDVKRLLNDE